MKSAELLKILSVELGTTDLNHVNQLLRKSGSEGQKYKFMGKTLGGRGFTVAIKAISTDGVKVYDIGKVRLIRFDEIESVKKAVPRVPREWEKANVKSDLKPAVPQSSSKKKSAKKSEAAEAALQTKAALAEKESLAPRAKVVKKKPATRGSSVIPPKYRHSIR